MSARHVTRPAVPIPVPGPRSAGRTYVSPDIVPAGAKQPRYKRGLEPMGRLRITDRGRTVLWGLVIGVLLAVGVIVGRPSLADFPAPQVPQVATVHDTGDVTP